MDIIRLCAWGYAALLGFVILTGYIPAFIDANDMIFGLFRRTWYADGLHLVSALWAAIAASTSRRASELFFQLFGVFFCRRLARPVHRQRLSRLRHLDRWLSQPAALDALLCQRAASQPRRRRDPDRLRARAADARRSMLKWLRRFYGCHRDPDRAVRAGAAGLYRGHAAARLRARRPPTTPHPRYPRWTSRVTAASSTIRSLPFPWYIVYSFEDFGRFLDGRARAISTISAISSASGEVFAPSTARCRRPAESRSEVKTMIYVIGISYSAEYAIKGLYENTIGRVFEWIRGDTAHAAGRICPRRAAGLCPFLYTVPWFKYPFREKLDGLMAISTPTPSIARTWERDFALGSDIRQDRLCLADPESAQRERRNDHATSCSWSRRCRRTCWQRSRVSNRLVTLTPHWQLVQTPRYKAFTEILRGLLDQEFGLAEIAGNREIFITVIAPDAAKLDVKDTTELFSLELDCKARLSPRRFEG